MSSLQIVLVFLVSFVAFTVIGAWLAVRWSMRTLEPKKRRKVRFEYKNGLLLAHLSDGTVVYDPGDNGIIWTYLATGERCGYYLNRRLEQLLKHERAMARFNKEEKP